MGDDRSACGGNNDYRRGWQQGRERLFSAFVIASCLSQGLSPDDIDDLSDYCSFLSQCFRVISQCERNCEE